jgi:hypothetical protein
MIPLPRAAFRLMGSYSRRPETRTAPLSRAVSPDVRLGPIRPARLLDKEGKRYYNHAQFFRGSAALVSASAEA